MSPFIKSLKQGYSTMDLMASFFFSNYIINYLRSNYDSKRSHKIFIQSALYGCLFLCIVYGMLIYIARIHYDVESTENIKILLKISKKSLGKYIGPSIFSITALTATLTTSIALTNLYVDFLKKTFNYQDSNTYPNDSDTDIGIVKQLLCIFKQDLFLLITLLTTTVVTISFANFKSLTEGLLTPAISILYPTMIAYTISSIIRYYKSNALTINLSRLSFFIPLVFNFFTQTKIFNRWN